MAQEKEKRKKHRFELNYQGHYSFRKIWWIKASPEQIAEREKEDSPVYSQSLGLKFNYSPLNWVLLQFGTATGTKGYGSETFRRGRNFQPEKLWETYSAYKPASFIGFNYALGPQIHLLKNHLTIFASIGHCINFGLPQKEDEVNLSNPVNFGYQYRGIYAVKAEKGFTFNDVNSYSGGLTPFMTHFNFGFNFIKKKYSFGINGTYEWNAKKIETRVPPLGASMFKRNYIYSYGVSIGYCW